MSTPVVFGTEIKQMMFVAGEGADPSAETVSLIENIVKAQIVHMITFADELAARRGSRIFSNNDLIFQLRHDNARVERLQKVLTLKHIRKSSKSDEEEYEKGLAEDIDSRDSVPNETDSSKGLATAARLPWNLSSIYPELPASLGETDSFQELDAANLEKLRVADEKTLHMSVDEYTTWSEYRHASFTRRRVIQFRQWCGLGTIGDHKSSDDVLDILGFLASEMVQRLTGLALAVQGREMRTRDVNDGADAPKRTHESPFQSDSTRWVKPAIEVRHVRRAYEITQAGGRGHGVAGKTARSQTGLHII
ncbi:Transcription initiation protein spt3 [Conoideocrella luteorostrata]|uniref:Transcription initiation protein spt3 n=1 Tax=Conoideocrella luteorostrata TaxID=1105319 RepID=A0AAJ0G1M3_9HYPO|nr:Transcription initiation protein spt3 [Conoideocrella luteorostrata]